jgi:hypothetical protein
VPGSAGRSLEAPACGARPAHASPVPSSLRRIGAALAVGAALVATRPLGAQGAAIDPQCGTATANARITQDACQKAIDIFQFMAPQLGAMLTGGNAVLGEHSALRGLGRVSLGLKVNGMEASLPRVDQRTPSTTGAVASDYAVRSQWVGVPVLDAAVGIFRGIPFGGTYALGVDALVNVAYIPELEEDDFTLEAPDGPVKLGFGGRVGVLAETFLTPGLSVTWLRRAIPTVNVAGRVSGDELNVRDMRVSTTAWRVVAGKNLSVFGVAVGGGQDSYDTRAAAQVTISRVVPAVTSAVVSSRQELTRTNLFANLSLNLPALRLVAEAGRVSGGQLATYNTFADRDADDPRTYASLGLRVTW